MTRIPVAVVGTDGTVGGPGGTPLSPAVVTNILGFTGAYFDTKLSSKAFVNDGVHSLNTSQLFLNDYTFTALDIGKYVVVTDGGTTGDSTITTISSIVSGKAVLAAAVSWASAGFVNGTVAWGHDDSVGYLNALTYLYGLATSGGGGGALLLPAGNSLVASLFCLTTSNPWNLGIFGSGVGVTNIISANAGGGWIQIFNGSRASRCTICNLHIAAAVNGGGKGFGWDQINPGGDQIRTFYAKDIQFESFVPTVGYFDCSLSTIGSFRSKLESVWSRQRNGPNVSAAINDDSPTFSQALAFCLDGVYTPKLINVNAWNCRRAFQLISGSLTQGFQIESSQAVGCREGFWYESEGNEPGGTILGGHNNCRDFGTAIFNRKIVKISDLLAYNSGAAPSATTTINQVGGIGTGDSTVTLTSVTGWATAGGMLTIDSEVMTYTSISGSTLQGLGRGAYGTTPATHINGATVYPNTMSTTTAIVNTGVITKGTAIPVVNTAGMPRIGAALLGSEWWTYDNLHQTMWESGTVTGGTYIVHFTWNGASYQTAALTWNTARDSITAAVQAGAPWAGVGVGSGSNGVNVSTFAGSGTLNGASSISSFAASGQLVVYGSNGPVTLTYTGKSGNAFTGVTLVGGSGTLSTGNQIGQGLPNGQVVCGCLGNIPANPVWFTYMYGITSIGPVVITSIDSSSLTGGGSYQITGTDYAHNLYNLSRAAFGTADPGSNYVSGTQVIAGNADILLAGGAYTINIEDNQHHFSVQQYRKCVQVQGGARNVTQSDNFLDAGPGYGAAIDGTASGCVVKDNVYSTDGNAAMTPVLNGATDTLIIPVESDKKITAAYGTTVTPDSLQGGWQTITVTNGTAFTIAAPPNPPTAGGTRELVIEVLNSSGGAMGVITWNGAFVFAGATWVNPANTKKRFARFGWNGANWICMSLSSADY